MRVIVTGGGGFIGYHLVKSLLSQGYRVKVIDNFSSAIFVSQLKKLDKVDIKQIDIRDKFSLIKEFKGFDVIFHLAALISVEESLKFPDKYYSVNVGGTLNVLEAARLNEIYDIFFASSAAVYGNPLRVPIDEEHIINPISIYGATKAVSEIYIRTFSNLYGFSSRILRLFNVYGPGQTGEYAGVISIFIRNILENRPLIIYGDGNQTRDFIFVNDVARIFTKLINRECHGFCVYNIGTGKPTSINGLVNVLEEIFMKKFKVIYKERKKGDIVHSYAENKKILEILGGYDFISLSKGIELTVEWFKNNCIKG